MDANRDERPNQDITFGSCPLFWYFTQLPEELVIYVRILLLSYLWQIFDLVSMEGFPFISKVTCSFYENLNPLCQYIQI